MRHPRSRRFLFLEISGGLFLLSLAMPAIVVMEAPLLWGPSHEKTYLGIHCLALGWLLFPGWLANPLLIAAALVHSFERHGVALLLTSLAVVSAVIAPIILIDGPDMMKLEYLDVGYYVWFASIIVLFAGAAVGVRQRRRAWMA